MFKFGKKSPGDGEGKEKHQSLHTAGKHGRRPAKTQESVRAQKEMIEEARPMPAQKRKKAKIKKKSMVYKIKDTAWDMIYEDLTGDDYRFSSDRGFYGLMLTETILQSVSSKDEALGSLLSLINKGVIKAMVTRESKEAEYVALLLDEDSIEALEEYTFVWDSPMEAVLIETDGTLVPTGFTYQLSDMQVFATADTSMTLQIGSDVLGGNGEIERGTEPDDYFDESFAGNGVNPDDSLYDDRDCGYEAKSTENTPGLQEDMPDDLEIDQVPSLVDEDEFGTDFMKEFDDSGEEDADEEFAEVFGEPEDSEGPDGNAEENSGYPVKEAVERVVKRVFSEGDLNLEVEAGLFDAQFPVSELVLFDENRQPTGEGDGHLEEYLNQLSSQANAALQYFHESNREYLREQYMSLMGMVCSHITGTTALDDPRTVSGKHYQQLKEAQEKQLGCLPGKVRDRTEEMNMNWHRRIEEAGNAAKEAAMQQYKQRYQRSHEDAIGGIGERLRRDIDVAFHKALDELNGNRKSYSQRMYDAGCNHTLSKISDMYRQKLEEEADIRAEFDQHITAFIRNNYKNEMTRVQVLKESLKQKTEADRVREEYESRLTAKSEELVRRAKEYDADVLEFKAKLDELARQKDEYHAQKMQRAEDRYKGYERDIAEYRRDILSVQDRTADEYKSQIRTLEHIIEGNRLQLNQQAESMKRKSGVSILAVVAMAVVMLSMGVLAGSYLKLNAIPSFSSSYDRAMKAYDEDNFHSSGHSGARQDAGDGFFDSHGAAEQAVKDKD